MRSTLLHESGGARRWLLVLDTGDEVSETLLAFAREQGVEAGSFTAIGALREVVLGYFDWAAKDYDEIAFDEQMEVLTLAGNLAVEDGEPQLHAHVSLGRADGAAVGGHVLKAVVRPTLELFLDAYPARLEKRPDEETGLSLIDPDAG